MPKGLMIDVMAARPGEEEDDFESAEPSADPEAPAPRQDGDAIIASIEAQLAELRSLMAAGR